MNERWLRVRHIALPYAPARRQREGDEHRVVSVDEPDDAVDDADDDCDADNDVSLLVRT